jgi:hypothetical protein
MKSNLLLSVMIFLSLTVFIKCLQKGYVPLILSALSFIGFMFLFYFFNYKMKGR